MNISEVTIAYYRKLARMCGVFPTAQNLRKHGYTLTEALRILSCPWT